MESAVLASSRLAGTSLAAAIRLARFTYPEPRSVGVLHHAEHPMLGVALERPPLGATTAFDADEAYRIAQSRVGPGSEPGPAIVLALASVEGRGSNGPILDRLVFALRWDDVQWMPSGPRREQGNRRVDP